MLRLMRAGGRETLRGARAIVSRGIDFSSFVLASEARDDASRASKPEGPITDARRRRRAVVAIKKMSVSSARASVARKEPGQAPLNPIRREESND